MAEFDPYNERDFALLKKVVKHNYDEMRGFRKVRRMIVETAQGHYYDCNDNDNPRAVRNPVNLLDQLQKILVRSLVQTNPRCRVVSWTKPRAAAMFQSRLNNLIKEIDLATTLRRCVQESILGYMGTAYTGLAYSERVPGVIEPFVDSIPLPDAVVDIGRDEFVRGDLIGHRFTKRIADMEESGLYDPDVLQSISGNRASQELRDEEEDKYGDDEESSLFRWGHIWQILIRPTNQMVFYAEGSSVNKPLRVASYDGPEFGPYSHLYFDRVPGKLMPNSLSAMLLDVADFVNMQYRKIFSAEDRSAEFWTYEGASEDDARRIRDAGDGEMIQVDNNAAVQRRTKGGTNPQALGTAMHGRQLFDEYSGFIRMLGGSGPIAETAAQEKIAFGNVSQVVRDMQLRVIDFTRSILRQLAWYEWTDPERQQMVEFTVGRNGRAERDIWSPEKRDGDFIEFEIDIEPDSMEHRSSRQQLTELMQAVQGVVIPMMQMPSDQPVILKTPDLVRKYAELANLPELQDVADYAADPSYVSNPQTGGSALRIPAGATSEGRLNGGSRQGQGGGGMHEDAIMAMMSSAGGRNEEG